MAENDASMTHVLAATAIDPASRIVMEVPAGLTIAEIVGTALPGATDADLARARVALVTDAGSDIVLRCYWARIRPRPGVRVVIRIVPGDGAVRAVLSIVVSVAAFALGGIFGPTLGAWLLPGATTAVQTAIGGALIAAGVSVLGALAINALIPPPKSDNNKVKSTYNIGGWQNRFDPGGVVPFVIGEMRYAPPFAARPYSEIVGDAQYLRALFTFGEGELLIDDIRIGQTSISEFDEVEIETRSGVADDLPVTLYPQQVVEEQVGVELTRPFPRDDDGEITQIATEHESPFGWTYTTYSNAPTIETPVVRTTGADASGVSIILAWPSGLIRFTDKGKKRSKSVTIRIEHRRVEADEWIHVTDLTISNKKTEGFYRQHSWTFPTRGRWQVRLTMMTDETEDSKIAQRTTWAALQTLRPEYPLAYPRPLALIAMRIKATHQLNGTLDNLNARVRRVAPMYDVATAEWISGVSQSPADSYRLVLQHQANPQPVADSGIDIAGQIEDWATFCDAKALTYNRVLEEDGTTLRDVLKEIAAAGRAKPRHDGEHWGVIIDRPTRSDLVIDHVNPRNSWGFSWTRTFARRPHALVVDFLDAGNDYQPSQITVRWPGYEGEITLTESLEAPGKVIGGEVWRETRRRQLELELRADGYEATQDGAARVATAGDTVMTSYDVISTTQWAGRVKAVTGALVVLDEIVEMEAGTDYAISWRIVSEADTIGQSVVRSVETIAGLTAALRLTGNGAVPEVGDLVHFGPAAHLSYQQIVREVEVTTDQCSILRLIDAAPEIDEQLDATEIPVWSSRVGDIIDTGTQQPAQPRWLSISSGLDGTDEVGLIVYLIAPGSSSVNTETFRIQHRLSGATVWASFTISAAAGGGQISGYATGDLVELRAWPISGAGIEGPVAPTITINVGADDAIIPAALDADAITVTTLLGGALVQFATGTDAATTHVQMYRSISPVLDRDLDAVGDAIAVTTQSSYSLTLGDTTRENMLSGPAMSAPAAWTVDVGWEVTGGVAQHTAGTADMIGQAFDAVSGKYYRLSYQLSGRTAGAVTPRITGGSDRPGMAASANGLHVDRIQATTGNDWIEWLASSDFDGALDDVVAYLETSACLAQGVHYVWLEPQNADDVPGPLSGPFAITIV